MNFPFPCSTLVSSLLILMGTAVLHSSALAPTGEKIRLWPEQAPLGDGKFATSDAAITVHRPEQGNGTAIIICRGGGYGGLVTGAEGHGIAKWLNAHGITGIVLEYRPPGGNHHLPLLDAQRAFPDLAHAGNRNKWLRRMA